MVIGMDEDKISLSMKRLQENPWDVLAKKYKLGGVVKAPVSRIAQFGAFLELVGGIQGLIHLSEISHGVVKDIKDFITVGETIEAKIINFEPKAKRIGLSLKALQEKPAPKKAPAKKDEAKADDKKVEKKETKKAAPKKEAKAEDKKEVKAEKKAPAKKTEAKKETKKTEEK
jgi:small subunit ribosomal protein S1